MDWKGWVVAARYWLTAPMRRRSLQQACQRGAAPVMVLFYHRVADSHPNGWTMSRTLFARQLGWLAKHFDLVSLDEGQRRIRAGCNQRPAVAITFDDGYAENCDYALPLLIERDIPCTYFVSLEHVTKGCAFPHDQQRGVTLPPNTVDELRWMAEQGIQIGAHTRTHADMGQIRDSAQLQDELVTSGRELEQILGSRVPFFAFPYGQPENLSAEAFQLAMESGYQGVCSAYGGYNFPGDDAFHLQRIHADPEMARLRNWLTVDPRKVSMVKRYEYEFDGLADRSLETADVRPV